MFESGAKGESELDAVEMYVYIFTRSTPLRKFTELLRSMASMQPVRNGNLTGHPHSPNPT